jgi:holo-[acyl-carrier protein] synthase
VNRIIGTGIDIIETSRIEKAMRKSPERFRARTFTDREVEYCEGKKNRFQHYAARFAAKEAAMKALGTGWSRGVGFSDIEIVNDSSGKPELVFHGKAKAFFKGCGGGSTFLSLSHSREYAVAQVILTG